MKTMISSIQQPDLQQLCNELSDWWRQQGPLAVECSPDGLPVPSSMRQLMGASGMPAGKLLPAVGEMLRCMQLRVVPLVVTGVTPTYWVGLRKS